jgi:hypothetical protein
MHVIPLKRKGDLSSRYITPELVAWCRWWLRKLDLQQCNVGLIVLDKIPGETKKVLILAQVEKVSKRDHLYLIVLSKPVATARRKWQQSLVHEILHIKWYETAQFIQQEEIIVEQLAPFISDMANLAGELAVKEIKHSMFRKT